MILQYGKYLIKPSEKNPNLYCISTVGTGGSIPAILDGDFTSYSECRKQIDSYLEGREKFSAKASTKGGNNPIHSGDSN